MYSRAIEEEADVDAMENLAYLLEMRGDGVAADPVRIADLNSQVIFLGNEKSQTEAIFGLCCAVLSFSTDYKHNG